MNYIYRLESELEIEKCHTEFLEKLLKILYGDGWEKLTLAEAKRCKIIRPHNNRVESDAGKRCFHCGSTNLEYDGTCRDC